MGKKPILKGDSLICVLDQVIDALRSADSFAQYDLARGADGKSSSVWDDATVQRDALGWVLKKSYDYESIVEVGRRKQRELAYKVSEEINEHVLQLTGRSLVAISEEDGCEAVAGILLQVAERLRATQPVPT